MKDEDDYDLESDEEYDEVEDCEDSEDSDDGDDYEAEEEYEDEEEYEEIEVAEVEEVLAVLGDLIEKCKSQTIRTYLEDTSADIAYLVEHEVMEAEEDEGSGPLAQAA